MFDIWGATELLEDWFPEKHRKTVRRIAGLILLSSGLGLSKLAGWLVNWTATAFRGLPPWVSPLFQNATLLLVSYIAGYYLGRSRRKDSKKSGPSEYSSGPYKYSGVFWILRRSDTDKAAVINPSGPYCPECFTPMDLNESGDALDCPSERCRQEIKVSMSLDKIRERLTKDALSKFVSGEITFRPTPEFKSVEDAVEKGRKDGLASFEDDFRSKESELAIIEFETNPPPAKWQVKICGNPITRRVYKKEIVGGMPYCPKCPGHKGISALLKLGQSVYGEFAAQCPNCGSWLTVKEVRSIEPDILSRAFAEFKKSNPTAIDES